MATQQKKYLSTNEIKDWQVSPPPTSTVNNRDLLKAKLKDANQDGALQAAGHHFTIGCVALEITQRCNLDCSACYLSDFSEAVTDLPLGEVKRRVDQIFDHYGENTNVQITGGDPTLRKRSELIEIVRYVADKGLRPALFTNGIKATRGLLSELKKAGLKDVAFHVDLTQERKGYITEEDLNKVRSEYINRADGLGLQVIFNTTVFDGNICEIPMLADFFASHANKVHLASFQMIADTGRGTTRERPDAITQENVKRLISKGAKADLKFDFPRVGHQNCNLYAKCIVAEDTRVPAFLEHDREMVARTMTAIRGAHLSRYSRYQSLLALSQKVLRHDPLLTIRLMRYGASKLWSLRSGLLKSRARVNFITFYVHNFMSADALEKERCEACVFMTMTRDGPISMCVHNAKRDDFILQPIHHKDGSTWSPLHHLNRQVETLPFKKTKGRLRREKNELRANRTIPVAGIIGEIETNRRKAV